MNPSGMSAVRSDPSRFLDTLRRVNLIFVHAGHLFEPEMIVQDLISEGIGRGFETTVVPAIQLRPDASPNDRADLLILNDFEAISNAPNHCHLMGVLRAAVLERLDAGTRVVGISRVPRLRFVGCPGSDILIDSHPCFPDPVDVAISGAPSWSVGAAGGRPALLNCLVRALSSESGNPSEIARAAISDVLSNAFNEIGPEVVSWLDNTVTCLNQRQMQVADIPAAVYEAVRGAGLATSNDGWLSCTLFPEQGTDLWKEALRRCADETIELPYQYASVVESIWIIERRLRAEVKELARRSKGKGWKESSLPAAVAGDVLKKARDEAFPTAKTLSDIPNPFDWLTFGELVALMEASPWARPAAAPWSYWRSLANDIMPIRNRVAHMRLLSHNDAQIAVSWRYRLLHALGERPRPASPVVPQGVPEG